MEMGVSRWLAGGASAAPWSRRWRWHSMDARWCSQRRHAMLWRPSWLRTSIACRRTWPAANSCMRPSSLTVHNNGLAMMSASSAFGDELDMVYARFEVKPGSGLYLQPDNGRR